MSEKTTTPSTKSDDEIDLADLFQLVWDGKWLICGITFAATVIAVILVLLLPNIYRAEALLVPNTKGGGDGLSSLASQYGGLASLAGIDLGSRSVDKTAFGVETLQSRKFISAFIERHDLLVPLIAAKGWNSGTGELVIDSNVFNSDSGKWVRDVRPPKKVIPSMQEARAEFLEILSVSQDKDTGFVTVSIRHYSPNVAKQWVDWLIDDLNATIMQEDVYEAEQAIAYLHEQISSTSFAELHTVFFSLIEDQMKTVMLARVSDEYLLKTLDPAVVPEEKAGPERVLIVIFGFILGGIIGLFVVIVQSWVRA